MTETTNTVIRSSNKEKAWSLKDDDVVIVYLCGTDFQHHLLCDSSGTTVYPSVAALRRNKTCLDECGIVEIEIKVRRWVQPQNMPHGEANDNI
jgi:hypothetical protein